MVLIKGKIVVEDAKALRQKSQQELKQYLAAAATGVKAVDVAAGDEQTAAKLDEIHRQIDSLRLELDSGSEKPTTWDISQRMKEILGLFAGLHRDVRLRGSTIMAETSTVLANASARALGDAQSIVDDIRNASQRPNFTYEGEYKRLAKEFQERFPTFLGYRVDAEGTQQGLSIYLEDAPPVTPEGAPPVMEALVPKVGEFLQWELKKAYDHFEVQIMSLKEYNALCIYCLIEDQL